MVSATEFLSCPHCGQTFLASGSAAERVVQCAHCAHQDGRQEFAQVQAPRLSRYDHGRVTTLPGPRAVAGSDAAPVSAPLAGERDMHGDDPHLADLPLPPFGQNPLEHGAPAAREESWLTGEAAPEATLEFECPACATALEIDATQTGEALDCGACGMAVIAPDPGRERPAMLFADLLTKMGVTYTQDAVVQHRQIAQFKLHPADDAMAWLDATDSPASGSREPRKTYAIPKPKRSYTPLEIGAAAIAVASVGAVGYALFLSPAASRQQAATHQDAPAATAVVASPASEPATAEPSDAMATRAPRAPQAQPSDGDDALVDAGIADVEAAGSPTAPAVPSPAAPDAKIVNFEKSRDALQAFFTAQSADERLPYILQPQDYEADVRRYHQEHGPVCFQLRELIHGQTARSTTDGHFWSSFLVQTNRNPRGFTVTMHETDSGPRLSWPAFVQYHDNTFETFLEQQPTEPQIFCATLSRGYSIDPNAPDPTVFHCFRVQGSETPRGKAKAYVDRRSLLGEQLERNLDWDSEMPVTAELQWVKNPKDPEAPPMLHIRDVLEYYW